MSSGIHLGFQSCPEPSLTELRPSRLKFDQPESQFSDSVLNNSSFLDEEINSKTQKESEMGGWSFLQSLSSSSKIIKTENEEEKLYVHPLTKHSYSSSLSLKSLEMCTESLGSETGSEEIHVLSSMAAPKNPRKQSLKSKRVKNRADFPPPLTSISGHDGLRMKAHRENGRLVLKVEAGHCCRSLLEVERGNGRLRLRMMKNFPVFIEPKEPEVDEEEEDREGINEFVGGKMGEKKFTLLRRCKEGGNGSKRSLRWAEPFWVAI